MGVNLLYLKGEPVETSRKTDELRCRVTAVYSIGTVKGVFYYKMMKATRWSASSPV